MLVEMVAMTELRGTDKWGIGSALEVSGYEHNLHDYSVNSDAEELFEAAGRLCYRSFNRPNPATSTNELYLKHITDVKHFSILEHASATFFVSGVSRAMLLELERHRFLSFSVVSQRYVDSSEEPIVIPPILRTEDALDDRIDIELHATRSRELYQELVQSLMSRGYNRKEARGAARSVLPEGTQTEFFVTGNIRCWREIIQKRYNPAADQEIREFAEEILRQLRLWVPNALQDFEE